MNICNYILGEFEIKDFNKKIRILNSFESYENKDKVKIKTFKYKNEKEIKNNIEIQINGNIIPFSNFYDFKIPGKKIIKYIFKNLLTKTVCLFADCTLLKKVDISHFNTDKVTNMNSMFKGCKLLKEIVLANINTQNVTDMGCMFYGCKSLKNLDVSKLNTEKVTNMAGLFFECELLNMINVTNFNTENVTNMCGMFYGCKSLEVLEVSKFNTENVTDMSYMFKLCESLKNIDVSKFNTKNVTNMGCMFYGCKSLKNLDVYKFNTEKVTNMYGLFFECELLNMINVTNFNTENVTNMSDMFYGCKSLKNLDLSKFNFKNVTDMSGMFSGCILLKDINIINFDVTKQFKFANMFDNCDSFPYTCFIYSNIINANNNTIDNNDINNIISKLKSKQNIIEYNNKINYKYIKEPNLKYKLKINYDYKSTIFEIFTSYLDNTDYIAYSDKSDDKKNLKIFYFYENKLKKKVSFEDPIEGIRYFINKNNYNEYLLIQSYFQVNILYITNNYINIFKYNRNCDDCLLVFPNENDIYFVYSYYHCGHTGYYSDEIEYYSNTYTEAQLLCSNKWLVYSNVDFEERNLLLSWYNKKDNLYYIIKLPKIQPYIHIYELKSKKKTYSLDCDGSINGFITHYDKDPNQADYLNILTDSNIYIYNLENGNLLKKIYQNFYNFRNIGEFIQWNDRYIIFIIDNLFLKILDLKIYKIITVIKSINDLCYIKKINHKIYGESLLISGKDSNGIHLWTI